MATVVADTSFLFALFGGDAHTAAAQTWAHQARRPITVNALNRYEFGNALRFAACRKLITQADALHSLAAFDADLKSGYLQVRTVDLAAVVAEAARLSERYTMGGGHRSFDVLHVAAASVLKATTFLSFDANQRKLAVAVELAVGP
ncbi:MAG: type II toxin-antitoxin system VapC family toxin [Undibacterium sp.]|nr:type II toxin-antitoxin system VapC family toxin [Opitutaceae bacterium]